MQDAIFAKVRKALIKTPANARHHRRWTRPSRPARGPGGRGSEQGHLPRLVGRRSGQPGTFCAAALSGPHAQRPRPITWWLFDSRTTAPGGYFGEGSSRHDSWLGKGVERG